LSLFAVNPRVTQLPHGQPIATGKEVTFRVEARGSGLAFQWKKDGSNLRDDNRCCGTNTDTLCIQQIEKDDEGHYSCLFEYNTKRKSSGNAQLTVCKFTITSNARIYHVYHTPILFSISVHPPRITLHPKHQTAVTGTKVTFCVEATGDDLKFQWQKDGKDLDNDHRIRDTDTNNLSIQSVQKSDKGCYRCLAKNAVDSKLSSESELSVCKLHLLKRLHSPVYYTCEQAVSNSAKQWDCNCH